MLLTACGKFSSSGDGASATTTEPGEIGGSLRVPATAPPVTTTTVAARPAASATTTKASGCPTKTPSSEIAYHDLKIVMNTSATCAAHKDDLTFTMTITNLSTGPLHYDANQLLRFTVLAPLGEQKHRWEDDDCVTPPKDRTRPALTLSPGDSISFSSLYPGPSDFTNREACRKLDGGTYEVHGVFLVCEASYQDGYCNISKDTQYQGDPIPITLS